MYGYIYKTTNLTNGKIYIGQHKADKLDLNYYGSGKLIQRALKIYGRSNFKIELLAEADDPDTLSQLEIYFIAKYNSAHSANGYNMSDGGHVPRLSGKNNGNFNHRWTAEMRAQAGIRKRRENLSPETIKKMSDARKGKHLSGENSKAHAVVQLTKQYEFIKRFETLRDGAKAVEAELNDAKKFSAIEYDICATCRHRQHTSFGYIWMYESEYLELQERRKDNE